MILQQQRSSRFHYCFSPALLCDTSTRGADFVKVYRTEALESGATPYVYATTVTLPYQGWGTAVDYYRYSYHTMILLSCHRLSIHKLFDTINRSMIRVVALYY